MFLVCSLRPMHNSFVHRPSDEIKPNIVESDLLYLIKLQLSSLSCFSGAYRQAGRFGLALLAYSDFDFIVIL